MIKKIVISLLFIALLVYGASWYEVIRLRALGNEIRELVDTRANDVTQCRVIAYGHALCGGPSSYLAYSVKYTNEEMLLPLVDRYNALAKERDSKRRGVAGICSIEMPPELGFDAKRGECIAQ